MRTGTVVIVDVRGEHTLEMPLVEDQDLVQTFLPNRTDPPFSKRMCIRRLNRCPDDRQPSAVNTVSTAAGKFASRS